MKIRSAQPSEAPLLSNLALRSKGHWPYDKARLQMYRGQLQVFEEDIAAGWTCVADLDDRIVGFYALSTSQHTARLEFMFVEPNYIGTGIGKALCTHALGLARARGWTSLAFFADAFAADHFYRHQGCRVIGSRQSDLGPLIEMQVEFY